MDLQRWAVWPWARGQHIHVPTADSHPNLKSHTSRAPREAQASRYSEGERVLLLHGVLKGASLSAFRGSNRRVDAGAPPNHFFYQCSCLRIFLGEYRHRFPLLEEVLRIPKQRRLQSHKIYSFLPSAPFEIFDTQALHRHCHERRRSWVNLPPDAPHVSQEYRNCDVADPFSKPLEIRSTSSAPSDFSYSLFRLPSYCSRRLRKTSSSLFAVLKS
jgi:hypothetical protein